MATFDEVVEFFVELLDAAREQEHIFVSFLSHEVCRLAAFALVTHVYYYQFVLFVFEAEKFGYHLISCNVSYWVTNRLFDSPEIVLFRVSQIEKQKACLVSEAEHIRRVSDG